LDANEDVNMGGEKLVIRYGHDGRWSYNHEDFVVGNRDENIPLLDYALTNRHTKAT
jgi:hypothetical protein